MSEFLTLAAALSHLTGEPIEGVDTLPRGLGVLGRSLAGLASNTQRIFDRLENDDLVETVFADAQVVARAGEWQSAASDLDAKSLALLQPAPADLVVLIGEYAISFTQFIQKTKEFASAAGSAIPADTSAEAAALMARLPEYALGEVVEGWVRGMSATAAHVLRALEILEPASDRFDAPVRLRLDKLRDFVFDPLGTFETVFRWGQSDFDLTPFVIELVQVIDRFTNRSLADSYAVVSDQLAYRMGPAVLRGEATPTPRLILSFEDDLALSRAEQVPVGAGWIVDADFNAQLAGPFSLTLAAPFDISAQTGTGPPEGHIELSLRQPAQEESDRLAILTLGEAVSITAAAIPISVKLGARVTPQPVFEPSLGVAITDGLLEVGGGEGDGFVSALLQSVNVRAPFEVSLKISPGSGLTFEGSGGLSIELPAHLDLGPLQIKGARISVAAAPSGDPADVLTEASAIISGQLGPLAVTLERIGVNLAVTFDDQTSGDSRPTLNARFQPPFGAGLALDAGVVKGGGYVSHDPAIGRYSGALELSIVETISVGAIGLVDTKLPGGEEGFAFLVLITAEFAPIQLGFGFTLNGVGGMIAINRSADAEAVREGVKGGAISNLLFPEDPIARAPEIISALDTFFPIEPGRLAVGPMVKVGWGTPTLASIELGVVLDMPAPFTILLPGVVRIGLPSVDLGIARFNIAFLGAWEQDKKAVTFFASLFDSHVTAFSISGDAAFALIYGDNPFFLTSVGGYHPRYTPPPTPTRIPELARLRIDFFTGNPQAFMESYFAVTSNTVQFGGRIGFEARVWKFSVDGEVGLDVLITIDPFQFDAEIYGRFRVRAFGRTLMGVEVNFSFRGPAPYHLRGRARLKILFAKATLRVNKTWGDNPAPPLPGIEVLELLAEAIRDPRLWGPTTLTRPHPPITLREAPDTDGMIVMAPDARLSFTQKVVPLQRPIETFGARRPEDGSVFAIDEVRFSEPGGGFAGAPLRDFSETLSEFPPGQFFDLTPEEKLAAASFDELPAGVELAPGAVPDAIGPTRERIVTNEVEIVEPQLPGFAFKGLTSFVRLFASFATRPSVLFQTLRRRQLEPGAVRTQAEPFVVASAETLSVGSAVAYANATDARLGAQASAQGNDVTMITQAELAA
ncbi:MAG: DUF6603 domain-containing protein [Pseudomonadota bacterium]